MVENGKKKLKWTLSVILLMTLGMSACGIQRIPPKTVLNICKTECDTPYLPVKPVNGTLSGESYENALINKLSDEVCIDCLKAALGEKQKK